MTDFVVGGAINIPDEVIRKIETATNRISQMEKQSRDAADKMNKSFRSIADNGLDYFLKKLEAVQSKINSLNIPNVGLGSFSQGATEATKLASSVTNIAESLNKMGSEGKNIAALTQEIKGINNALRKEGGISDLASQQQQVNYRERLKSELSFQEKSETQQQEYLERLVQNEKRKNERIAREQKRSYTEQAKYYQQQNYKANTTVEGSLAFAKSANTIARRTQAIKYLTEARRNLSTTDANYKTKLDALNKSISRMNYLNNEATGKLEEQRRRMSNLANITEQLARKFALVFSVSQITSYVTRLREVRGEFELQNTALASILQNQDKANRLFNQITELAVQSPFTVKELTTYTKSLAAYQVQYEQLYDTTKMLADVSAGLGVDMQRLILAFGQVKAANVLRGCLGYDTPVMLYNGDIKAVQDIVVGDVLINENGDAVNVLELIRGRETMYLIEQVSGHDRMSYRVNRNHILTLWNVQEQQIEDVYVYDYLKNKDAYLGFRIVNDKRVYYDIEVTKDKIDDYYGFVLDGNKRFRLGDGTVTHNTETRQFTEAGFNILGELAKYYSELEGRIVSVAEVQDRQFKKMIAFEDVAKVFQRVTSEGGMFYKMQERQAETLVGLYSNLQDKVDLMLNSIGQSQEGILKGSIKFLGAIVDNYELVTNAIAALGAGFVLYKLNVLAAKQSVIDFATAQGLANASSTKQLSLLKLSQVGWTKLGASIKAAALSMKAFVASNLPLLAISALVSGVVELINWYDEYNEKLKAVRQRNYEYASSLDKITESYNKLKAEAKTMGNITLDSDIFKEQRQELQNLIDLLDRQGVEFPIDIKFVTPQNIDEAFTKGINLSELANKVSTAFGTAFSKASSEVEAWGLLGDNIVTDAEQLANTYALLDSTLESNLDNLEKEVSVQENLSDKAKEYLSLLRQGRKEDESDTDWMIRRMQYLKEISSELFRGGIKLDNIDVLDKIHVVNARVIKDQREMAHEVESLLERFEETYGGIEKIKKDFANKPEVLQLILDKKFLDENWDKQVRSFAERFAMERYELNFVAKEVKPDVTAFGDFRDVVKAMDTTGVLRSALPNISTIGGLESELQKLYAEQQKQIEVLNRANTKRLDIEKLIAKEKSKMNLSNSEQERVNAEANIKALEAQKKGVEENIKRTKEQANANVEVIKAIAEAFNLLLVKEKESNKVGKTSTQILKERLDFFQRLNSEYKQLRENYSAEEAHQRIMNSRLEEAKALGVEGIFKDATFDEKGTIKSLNKVGDAFKSMTREMNIDFQNAIGDVTLTMDVEVREKELQSLSDYFDSLFSGYELSIDLEGTGVSKDMQRSIFGIEAFDLQTIQRIIDDYKKRLGSLSKEEEKLFTELQKKLTNMQNKELQERVKTYSEYLKKTVSERAAIELEAQKKLSEFETIKDKFSESDRKAITDRIKKERDEELAKYDWKEFQGTDMYIELFQNLEYATTSAIRAMKSRLSELKESLKDLPPEQLKEILSQMEKLEDIEIKRNPFKFLFSGDLKTSSKSLSEIGTLMQEISTAATDIAGNLENVFGTMDDKTRDIVDSFSEIASGIGNTASGVARIMAGDYIGGSIQALQGLASTIGSIFSVGDKAYEREIQRQLEIVENLGDAYDDLKEASEKAFSVEELKEYNKALDENIDKQITALKSAIAAEEAKKKSDKDEIEEYYKQIEELEKERAENQKSYLEELGAIGEDNYKSAAQNFIDAWLDAFLETGDGLDALNGEFEEFFNDMIKKQLLIRGANKFLEHFFEEFDKMFEGDGEVTKDELENIGKLAGTTFEDLNDFLINLAESLGIKGGVNGGELSELTKGIQGITETTAQALEAILNSMRYYVVDSNSQLKLIYNAFTSLDGNANPMLAELRTQTVQLRNMYELWNTLTRSVVGSGKVLKVSIV